MIKKAVAGICMAFAALAICGCASVKVADDFGNQRISENDKNVAHIYATNWGLYCFSLPLITGSAETPGAVLFGEDTVNPKTVVKMVTKKSAELGGTKTLDLDTKGNSIWIFPLFVVFLNECQVSGNAVK